MNLKYIAAITLGLIMICGTLAPVSAAIDCTLDRNKYSTTCMVESANKCISYYEPTLGKPVMICDEEEIKQYNKELKKIQDEQDKENEIMNKKLKEEQEARDSIKAANGSMQTNANFGNFKELFFNEDGNLKTSPFAQHIFNIFDECMSKNPTSASLYTFNGFTMSKAQLNCFNYYDFKGDEVTYFYSLIMSVLLFEEVNKIKDRLNTLEGNQ